MFVSCVACMLAFLNFVPGQAPKLYRWYWFTSSCCDFSLLPYWYHNGSFLGCYCWRNHMHRSLHWEFVLNQHGVIKGSTYILIGPILTSTTTFACVFQTILAFTTIGLALHTILAKELSVLDDPVSANPDTLQKAAKRHDSSMTWVLSIPRNFNYVFLFYE